MLQISTDEVYGSIEKGLFTEESPISPNSPYAASKASADLLVRAYHETYGMDVLITRCSNNYGPYQFPEKLIPLVISHAIAGKQIPVYGDGKNVRDWIYVLDHCKAIDAVFHRGNSGEVYNAGGKNECRNIDIIKKLLYPGRGKDRWGQGIADASHNLRKRQTGTRQKICHRSFKNGKGTRLEAGNRFSGRSRKYCRLVPFSPAMVGTDHLWRIYGLL